MLNHFMMICYMVIFLQQNLKKNMFFFSQQKYYQLRTLAAGIQPNNSEKSYFTSFVLFLTIPFQMQPHWIVQSTDLIQPYRANVILLRHISLTPLTYCAFPVNFANFRLESLHTMKYCKLGIQQSPKVIVTNSHSSSTYSFDEFKNDIDIVIEKEKRWWLLECMTYIIQNIWY